VKVPKLRSCVPKLPDVSVAVPLALLAVIVILLAAMPWRRPHPNHQFMLELLRSQLEDEQTNSRDSQP